MPNIFAAEPWQKSAAEWSQQDVYRLLNDSPWAVVSDATMDDPGATEPAVVTPPVAASIPNGRPNNDGSSVNGGRWDGAITKTRKGHLATIPVLTRWDSAKIIRQALEQGHDPDIPGLAGTDNDFIVSVIGLFPANKLKGGATLKNQSSNDDSDSVRTTEEVLEWFMSHSRLLMKGRAALEPHNVKINQATGALHLYFKRAPDVAWRKQDVVLVTRYGSMNVQARFRMKNMVAAGEPDL